ncbi:MAG: DNA polymerase III subunit delta [Deltaproteobacteria bacterium]|nr:DNA polymerase III subunit delta [Deltaproteobacteria bacterium]
MAADLRPEDVTSALEKGRLAPFYLFYGPNEFIIERVLEKIRDKFIPENARDFNMEICYGGELNPSDIVNRAQSIPFLSANRLIILKKTDAYKAEQLNKFVPYLEKPVDSTCLIFLSEKTDFKNKFYRSIRAKGLAVNFSELKSYQVPPWIQSTAREIGLNIDRDACALLLEITGGGLRKIYGELEKLRLSFGDKKVKEADVRELAINSRIYTIFELMDALSEKKVAQMLSALSRFLDEEDKKSAPFQIIGMLNRQIGLLWQVKILAADNNRAGEIASKLAIAPFSVEKLMKQSRLWSHEGLKRGISLLYETDRLLKSGARTRPVLENLFLSLCTN